ncbi:IS66 family insertion sequence element accessory protein TnpA [Alicyclobacillus sp. ALC3]|uniref:IS66 family insertion sequence element accessory protein TnpA n=1 Tax=Alicyclobacillus sp. ALC3 TaxID=2796143 RepID=UPI002378CACF|nr:hypothetical protein [Alicyclobacillus sp. ALC3]WDL97935.1 hypothetical protein JC200_04255 [Alicyclobacillus sp. ALC3]
MSRVGLRQLWEGRVRAFRESGQSATTWCSEQHFNIHQLRYWMRKFPSPCSVVHASAVAVR